jgi:hypothetical protein
MATPPLLNIGTTPPSARLVLHDLLRMGREVQMLQIGANDGSAASNDPVQGLLLHPRIRAILVEPNPAVHRALQANLRARLGAKALESGRVRTVNRAVCSEEGARWSGARNITFHMVSAGFQAAFPSAPHWALYQLGSLQRTYTVSGLATYLARARSLDRDAAEALAEKHVDAVAVECLTPAALLRTAQISPSAVDVFATDVEGLDVAVVGGFLALGQSFSPAFLSFEAKVAAASTPAALRTLLGDLSRRGYRLSCRGVSCSSDDAFAWRNASTRRNATDGHPATRAAAIPDVRFAPACLVHNGCCKRHPRLCASDEPRKRIPL